MLLAKKEQRYRCKRIFCQLLIIFLWQLFFVQIQAQVTGRCDNCHTMHNSQDGTTVDPNGPNQYLLVSNCIGCHSSTDGGTWKDSTTGAPIVYNTAEPTYNTQKGLAGGNFYYVMQDQSKGHNVADIPGIDEDENFPPTPGGLDTTSGATKTCGSCHDKPGASGNLLVGDYCEGVYYSGCQYCHGINSTHHADDTTIDGSTPGKSYRCLKTFVDRATASPQHSLDGVKGIEVADYEKDVTSSTHNEYCGTGVGDHSISRHCAFCHGEFHGINDTQSGSSWIRHPSDHGLPGAGTEYAAYTIYSPEAPIARKETVLDGMSGPSSDVETGTADADEVSCISCHRAHGSPYADMLRWDYSGMIAGGGGGSGGCFTCHTAKDD